MKVQIAAALLTALVLSSVGFGQGGGGFGGGTGGTGGTGGGTGGFQTGTGTTGGFGTGGFGTTSGMGTTGTGGTTGMGTGTGTTAGFQSGPLMPMSLSGGTGTLSLNPTSLVNSAIMGRSLGGGLMGGMGGMGMGGMGMGGMGGRTGMNTMNNQNQQNQNKLRTTIKLGFSIPHGVSPQQATQMQTRLGRLPISGGARRVQVVATGNTVVLRGTVPSRADATLVERLIKLEPGVRTVRNELVVEGANNSTNTPPAELVPAPAANPGRS